MPRLSSLILLVSVVLGAPSLVVAVDDLGPHLDPDKITESCSPCHRGHGASGTAMLKGAGDETCLDCHDGATERGLRRTELGMSLSAKPSNIASQLRKAVTHRGASCMDCHSIHGVSEAPQVNDDSLAQGSVKPSPKRGFEDEARLCLSCHGTRGPRGDDPLDLAQLFDPSNRSYHPVLAPRAAGNIPSLKEPLTPDSMINCSDCHTNDDPAGPRGPHGSRVPGLLGADYVAADGQPESLSAYSLCYACHERVTVLEKDLFPLHQLHVVDERAACATCHNPHGATKARALIRFNEPTSLTNVSPSSSGLVGYVSESPGAGACYLTCHGKDHDPLAYGATSQSLSFSPDVSSAAAGSTIGIPDVAGAGSEGRFDPAAPPSERPRDRTPERPPP